MSDGMDAIEQELAARKARQVYVFTVPEKVRRTATCGTKTIGMVKLTLMEEKTAAESAGSSPAALHLNSVHASLRMVDGKPVGPGDGSSEAAMAKMDPQVRSLVSAGYNTLHGVDKEGVDAFLGSLEVRST